MRMHLAALIAATSLGALAMAARRRAGALQPGGDRHRQYRRRPAQDPRAQPAGECGDRDRSDRARPGAGARPRPGAHGPLVRHADPDQGQYRDRRAAADDGGQPGARRQRHRPRRAAGRAAARGRRGDPRQDQPLGMGEHPLEQLDLRLERGRRPDAQSATRSTAIPAARRAAAARRWRPGMVPAAIGTETDGSITCPAAINGIVGLKPTVGLVSRTHIVPISHSQDTAGPMARTRARRRAHAADRDRRHRSRRSRHRARPTGTGAIIAAGLSAGSLQRRADRRDALRRRLRHRSRRSRRRCRCCSARARCWSRSTSSKAATRSAQNENIVLLTELKADMDAYLATTPAGRCRRARSPTSSPSTRRMPTPSWRCSARRRSRRPRRPRGSTMPTTKRRARPRFALAGPEGIDRLLRENNRRRPGRPDHAAGLADRRGERRPDRGRRRRRPRRGRRLSAPHRADGAGEGAAGRPQLHRPEMVRRHAAVPRLCL